MEETDRINFPLNAGKKQQGLQLRRKRKTVRLLHIIERFYPEPIMGTEKPAAALVMNDKGEHAVEVRHHLLTFLVVKV